MKRVLILASLALMMAFKAQAAEENATQVKYPVVPFEGVQENCVQTTEITFGPNGHWASCHVTRGRWVATIDLVDMYQAQYCLGKDENKCEQRALLLFANRAYTIDASILLQRLDSPDTIYDDPQVVMFGDERLMSVGSRTNENNKTINYYMWDMYHWMPMPTPDLQRDIAAKLPRGTKLKQMVYPNLVTMSAEVDLLKASDADCCATGGKANIEFGFENKHFLVKKVQIIDAK